ncbi:MAG: tetratricopeptide repeat protein [Calothrix sp. CSU_2_0]|nr:tetratricopeptide repeat protein [Calothrix sp. CSU_2_0]
MSRSQGAGSAPTPEAIATLEEGLTLRSQSQPIEAYAAFEQAIRFSPGYAEAYVAKAGLLFKQGRSIEAIAAYDQALSLNPHLAAAYLGKGQALARQGKRPESREFLKSARKTLQANGHPHQADIIQHLLPGL